MLGNSSIRAFWIGTVIFIVSLIPSEHVGRPIGGWFEEAAHAIFRAVRFAAMFTMVFTAARVAWMRPKGAWFAKTVTTAGVVLSIWSFHIYWEWYLGDPFALFLRLLEQPHYWEDELIHRTFGTICLIAGMALLCRKPSETPSTQPDQVAQSGSPIS